MLALSGVEAITLTGVMKLNKGCSEANPNVCKTSTPALLLVMLEVCIFTAVLSLAMHALPNLTIDTSDLKHPDVNATGIAGSLPAASGVRDYILRYMGQVFVGGALGPTAGHIAGWLVSAVFGLLLLSAVNTAIVALIGISFLMSRDGELPPGFQKLNEFGVPNVGLLVATIIPAILVLTRERSARRLADLYAVGVVGAIATKSGGHCSTDRKLGLVAWERTLMFVTFLIMLAIEFSLFADKPSARVFAMAVLVVGLILRGLAAEYAQRAKAAQIAAAALAAGSAPASSITTFTYKTEDVSGAPMMCAIRGVGKTLDFAIEISKTNNIALFIYRSSRSLPVLTEQDYKRKWQDDQGGA